MQQTLTHESQLHYSHLFTVRVWREELGEGRYEWRGKVQHVMSGEVCYFREGTELIEVLIKMLSQSESDEVSRC